MFSNQSPEISKIGDGPIFILKILGNRELRCGVISTKMFPEPSKARREIDSENWDIYMYLYTKRKKKQNEEEEEEEEL